LGLGGSGFGFKVEDLGCRVPDGFRV